MMFSKVNVKPLEVNAVSGFTHRFACMHGGLRSYRRSHHWSEEAAGAITNNSTCVTTWLMLADRLQDEGNEAHHVIRYIFSDGVYEMPKNMVNFSISRGSNYFESGDRYVESAYASYTDADGLTTSNYANCGWNKTRVTIDEVRELITATGGRNCDKWYNLHIEINIKATRFLIPAGTEVDVKQCSEGDKHYPTIKHVTKEDIVLENPEVNFAYTVGKTHGKWVVACMTCRLQPIG